MHEGLSVIIPVYNAASWLKPTVGHISAALKNAAFKPGDAEIIIVNDGSSDSSLEAARSLSTEYKIVVVDQPNSGRFLARKAGLLAANKGNILFIDSRVFLHLNSLKFLVGQIKKDSTKQVWNGHVVVDKTGNTIARFGDAITFIGWRRYFANPRTCSYGLEDFDHYPKGTGCFLAPRDVLLQAVSEFEKQTFDIKNSSDDTHLIRIIARRNRINLSPEFSCTYHARTKLKQFIVHSYNRGRFFVDGFLRSGNRFFVPLIIFLLLSLVGALAFLAFAPFRPIAIVILATVWLVELVAAIVLRVPGKDALSLFVLSPLFAVAYGLGIWQAVARKTIHSIWSLRRI